MLGHDRRLDGVVDRIRRGLCFENDSQYGFADHLSATTTSPDLLMPTRRSSATAPLLAVVLALATGAIACSTEEATTDGTPTIIATTDIWADVVGNVACDDLAAVETLLPTGTDPHDAEISLADRARLADADLVVANGAGLEAQLIDALDDVAGSDTTVVDAADLTGIPGGLEGDPDTDPHLWFDPTVVDATVVGLRDVLVDDLGLDATAVDVCVSAYRAELSRLDTEIRDATDACTTEQKVLITNHDALSRYADRYGFEVLGTVIPAPNTLAETNPAVLAELASLITERGVPAIFAETLHDDRDVEALAAEVGDVEVVTLYPGTLGDAGSGADTYLGLLRIDTDLIVGALCT